MIKKENDNIFEDSYNAKPQLNLEKRDFLDLDKKEPIFQDRQPIQEDIKNLLPVIALGLNIAGLFFGFLLFPVAGTFLSILCLKRKCSRKTLSIISTILGSAEILIALITLAFVITVFVIGVSYGQAWTINSK